MPNIEEICAQSLERDRLLPTSVELLSRFHVAATIKTFTRSQSQYHLQIAAGYIKKTDR